MNFLPDVHVPCESCAGKRFSSPTLEILYRGKTIADVLAMSIEEAAAFFSFDTKISKPLQLMQDTGLGYLCLGQSSPTLSGGEAQRLKLVTELMKGRPNPRGLEAGRKNLYLLEEPSIGLHFSDIEKLIQVLHRLVDEGHTVVLVEHHLDLIAEADYVIDLGPGGGDRGGLVVKAGTPEEVAKCRKSETGRFLRPCWVDRQRSSSPPQADQPYQNTRKFACELGT